MIVNTTCIISMHLSVSMILTYSMCIEFDYKEMKQKCGLTKIIHCCEGRELPSQYGRPKKRNKIFNIGRRTILYKTFSYSFSILN